MSEFTPIQEPNNGPRAVAAILLIVALFIIAGHLQSCRTYHVGTSHDRDSIRVEHRIDTFTINTIDSIRIQLPCSDTIQIAYRDRWRTQTIYKATAIHDTIRSASTDTIYQPYPVTEYKTQNSRFATFTIWVFFLLLAYIIGRTAWWAFKKFYIHR